MPDELVPRRVAIVTGANLAKAAPGGTRSYILGLSAFLVAQNIRVVVLTNGPIDDAPSKCETIKVTSQHVPSSVGFQRALRAWSRRNAAPDADVIHFQRPDDILAFSPRIPLPPAVCTLHGNPYRGIRRRHGPLLSFAYRAREARGLRGFRSVIAVDEATADLYRARYPLLATRIHVVPVAVRDDWSSGNGLGPDTSAAHHPPTFLYAGRLSVEKRVDRIIGAFREIGIPEARLLIAGTGPEEGRLRRLADSGKIEFLGNVPHDVMPDWYRRADALVLASQYEGLPTVALESLACGCPVVALAGCGLDSILDGHVGIVVKYVSELPAAMRNAVRLKETTGEIAVPKEYTWSSVGPRMLAIYSAAAREGTA